MLNFILSLRRSEKRGVFLVTDLLLVPVCAALALAFLRGPLFSLQGLINLWPQILFLLAATAAGSLALGIYRIRLKSFGRSAVSKVFLYAAGVALTSWVFSQVNGGLAPIRFHALFGVMFFLFCTGSRYLMLEALLALYRRNSDIKTILIYGAGKTGMQLASALKSHPEIAPIGFLDDNAGLKDQIVHGLPVFPGAQLESVISETRPARVVVAMPSVERMKVAEIERRLDALEVEYSTVPSFAQIVDGQAKSAAHVSPTDFLGRADHHDTLLASKDTYAGRNVLISGAGGSIGSELCRQVIKLKPARLVLFEHSELALYNIEMELASAPNSTGVEIIPVLGSVCDGELVAQVLADTSPDVVLHAAAYKHVPLVEKNVITGLANNVMGTHVIASRAMEAGVDAFVLVSSDKAVRPRNVMGASKRFAELIILDLASRSKGTSFSAVRFGNVLGSSGSVIPLFQAQVARGGPVTVTEPEATRYFMSVQEAAQLVLTAGGFAREAETFVLDMGAPVRIIDLARQVIERSGLTVRDHQTPQGDIEIVITGLRPGEKMHEELTTGTERLPTRHPKIFAVDEGGALSELEIAGLLRDLRDAITAHDADRARALLIERLVPAAPLRATPPSAAKSTARSAQE